MTDNKVQGATEKKLPPNAGKGRTKGVPNKTTQAAKDAIAMAADRLGGVDRLVEWAQEDPSNERAFWTAIYPKLLPLQVNGAGTNGEHLLDGCLRVEFVPAKRAE
jgi:hypothetical protein